MSDHDEISPLLSDAPRLSVTQNHVRDPYLINGEFLKKSASDEDFKNLAQSSRYRYYSKIDHLSANHSTVTPDHVLWPHDAKTSKQSSLVTIFAIWNTLMGTSLLSLPWAVQQSGFALGVMFLFLMGFICLYTALIIIRSVKNFPPAVEFIDVCEKEVGKIARLAAYIFGLVAFIGTIVVYWVLMSNFLYKVGIFFHEHLHQGNDTFSSIEEENHGVLCLAHTHINKSISRKVNPSSGYFYDYWDQRKTVPLYLIVLLLPLSSFKSPTFFTKFNSLGTVSVLYILILVTVKSIQWGPNLHFNSQDPRATSELINTGFPALTGILALALFIHNSILSILATNRRPQKNSRDVTIAFILTASTYFFVAILFYVCFPLSKDCIGQVFLDNFISSDIMAIIARFGLLFQMTTVFPLIMYMTRVQLLTTILNKSSGYSYLSIILLNVALVSLCVLFAVFYPEVGHIVRYAGSISGMVYIFILPPLVLMVTNRRKKVHDVWWKEWLSVALHSTLMILGVVNLVAQFLMTK